MSLDPYGELGVPRDATEDQIKAAHRNGVRKHHPDAGGSPEKFGALQRSYEILADPDARAKYDRTGEIEGPTVGQMEAKVLEGVSQIISMVIGDAMDLETTNVRQVLLDTLAKTTAALAEQKRDAERRLKRLEKLEKNMRRRKGKSKAAVDEESAILKVAFHGQRVAFTRALKKIEENAAMHERVCGVFKAFDYDFTAPPPTHDIDPYASVGYMRFQEFGFRR